MDKLRNRYIAFLFGGHCRQKSCGRLGGGFGWRPNLYDMLKRYYREEWHFGRYFDIKRIWNFIKMEQLDKEWVKREKRIKGNFFREK